MKISFERDRTSFWIFTGNTFEAGSDIVETNSFGGAPIVLAEIWSCGRCVSVEQTRGRAGATGGG